MQPKEILHVAQDEKFINAAYYLFEKAFPGANRFIIVKPPADPPIRYLNTDVISNSQQLVRSEDTFDRLSSMINNHKVTVFHGIDKLKGGLFLNSAHQERIMTIVYGAEIYNQNMIGNELLGEKTKKLEHELDRYAAYEFMKNVYRRMRYKKCTKTENVDIREVLYKMNTYGSLPGFSYKKFIEKKIYNPQVAKVPFSYYPIEYIIKVSNLRANGPDILLGNSASATNNHLEAIDILSRKNLKNKKVFAPLSYGKKKYAKAIASYGKKHLRDNFDPLFSFLPLEEYNKLISRCGVVIMNHYRPQAMGNIIASLYMGAKVFLNETEAYNYFKDLGCHIFLINEDLVDNSDSFELLTDEQVEHNRRILKDELSMSSLVDGLQKSFKKIFNYDYLEDYKMDESLESKIFN